MKRPAIRRGFAVEVSGIRIERSHRELVETRQQREREEREYAERQLKMFAEVAP